jgi:hypothetical protein
MGHLVGWRCFSTATMVILKPIFGFELSIRDSVREGIRPTTQTSKHLCSKYSPPPTARYLQTPDHVFQLLNSCVHERDHSPRSLQPCSDVGHALLLWRWPRPSIFGAFAGSNVAGHCNSRRSPSTCCR